MKTEFNFKNAKEGDKVYHVSDGWTEITAINEKSFYIKGYYYSFRFNGKFLEEDQNPSVYPYNPFENQERVVEVLTSYGKWVKRVLIIEKDGVALCWSLAETLEEAKNKSEATTWKQWREIQEPQKELTQEEKINILWEKYGKEL